MGKEDLNTLFKQEVAQRVGRGVAYLQKGTDADGLCRDYDSESIGISDSWISTCVGAALAEFDAVPKAMVESVVNLQDKRGGWGWNGQVPSDADATLRALKFLKKAGFNDPDVFRQAEAFVLAHQQPDGGIATFYHEDVGKTRHDVVGWADSHPEVSAFALKHITNLQAKEKITEYLQGHIKNFGYASFWWDTQQYLSRDLAIPGNLPVDTMDPLDLALDLLRKTKHGVRDDKGTELLIRLQEPNGQFPPTNKLTFPPFTSSAKDVMSGVSSRGPARRDNKGMLATSLAVVALHKQNRLT